MRRYLKMLFLRHRLATLAEEFERIAQQRSDLDRIERHYNKEAGDIRVRLLNFELRNRRA